MRSKSGIIHRKISIAYADKGTIFGEECFLDSERYQYSVTAKSSEARLLELPRSCLKEILLNDMYEDIKEWAKKSR